MLFLVATPIGNLSDITFRAVETLRRVDLILCEDTRYSSRLLQHYQIAKPCKSLHKFNESARMAEIIDLLKEGKKIALISDAGTPGISDPGESLVKSAMEAHIPTIPIPGPCAAIAAISCSGLPTTLFQFCGFLPRKEGELKKALLTILAYPGTSICYESPKRINAALKLLNALAPERQLVIAREMTKIHESFTKGNSSELYARFQGKEWKGEIVLLIEGEKEKNLSATLSPEEHVAWITSTYQVSEREAIKIAAAQRGVSKREVYNKMQEHAGRE